MFNNYEVFQNQFNRFHQCDQCQAEKGKDIWFGYFFNTAIQRDGILCFNCVNSSGIGVPELMFVGKKTAKPYWTFNKKIVEMSIMPKKEGINV